MPDRPVLVDTSAWIAFLRPGDSAVGDAVTGLVRADRATLVGPVLAELLQGVRGSKEASRLRSVFTVLPYVADDRSDWESAGDALRLLRAKGVTVPLTDALIAAIAKRQGLDVLTLDAHFQHLDVALVPVG